MLHRWRLRFPKGEVTVAFLSFIVSIVVFATAYESQILDRYYREAAVRPWLVLAISEDGERLELRNDGLGTADVDRLDFTDKSSWERHSNLPFNGAGGTYLYNKGMTLENIKSFVGDIVGHDINLESDVKLLDWQIYSLPAGQKRSVFEIDKLSLLRKLEKLHPEDIEERRVKIENVFENFSDLVNIRACYCSITKFYCAEIVNRFKTEYDRAREKNKCEVKFPTSPGSILGLKELIWPSEPVPEDRLR